METAVVLAWVGLAFAASEALGAGFLILRQRGNPSAWLLAVSLGILAFRTSYASLPLVFGGRPTYEFAVWNRVTAVVFNSSLIAAALIFPARQMNSRRWATIAVSYVPAFLAVGLALARPELAIDPVTRGQAVFFDWFLGAFNAVAYGGALLVFGARWWREPPGAYRDQFAVVLLPTLLWIVNDSVAEFAGYQGTFTDGLNVVVGGAMLVMVAVFAGRAPLRRLRMGQALPAGEWRFTWFVGLALVLATLQFLGALVGSARVLHLVVDGFGLILLAYGVVRWHILDIDLRVKRNLPRGAVGAAALVILLIAQQLLEQWVGATQGWLVGAVIAGLALFALHPLQRTIERISDRAMPSVQPNDAYFTFRRLELYKVALEGALRDGATSTAETRMLTGLRTELGISMHEHTLVERDVLARLRTAPARG